MDLKQTLTRSCVRLSVSDRWKARSANKLGQYQDEALKRPVTITKNNRERLVMLSIEEYRRRKQLDRNALFVEELSDAELEAISKAEVPVEYDHLNTECES